ncbi:uncharacterized protein LOC113865204 [Abrus precatorius]|uniref:Uncharacterized protein LOC113865204 n=1 Tax=Abrus precatorius TaxID=3816 RepID=A0A8B8LGC5_ABRPR|nr:uncharacterized protein LOC113865204 [Abrus precatorius]
MDLFVWVCQLYAKSLRRSKLELKSTTAVDQENRSNECDGDDVTLDGSLWDGSDDKLDSSSDLDREWQRRHDQFHTIGYRDGLMAGKQASAQEGFNIELVFLAGYSWLFEF